MMTSSLPRAGYTLPVFACAAAIAALRSLYDTQRPNTVVVDLIEPARTVEIPIEQVARLSANSALAISRSDPGDNLDLTKNTPIWAWVELTRKAVQPPATAIDDADREPSLATPSAAQQTKISIDDPEAIADSAIAIAGGEGIGRQIDANNQPAIYAYAQRLLRKNLKRWLKPEDTIKVTLILPEGRGLAQRTSNAAFGVVDGLSLLGTSGIAQPLSAPGQLEAYRQTLQHRATQFKSLVMCIGENGLDLAAKMGIDRDRTLKTANWLGPLLVEAGCQGVEAILLFGYHGKLMKLAAGIFHTHHHVADGRLEILTAHCANSGLPTEHLPSIFASPTAEAGLQYLRQLDAEHGSDWVRRVYGAIAQQIDQRAQTYIQKHSEHSVKVGSILFDRDRQLIATSEIATALLPNILTS